MGVARTSALPARLLSWGPVLAVAGLIFWGSSRTFHLPFVGFPGLVLGIGAHMGQYALLSLVLRRALGREGVASMMASMLAVALAVAYGVTDEIHQSFVPGRSASVWDLVADAIGAVIGVGLYASAETLMRRSKA